LVLNQYHIAVLNIVDKPFRFIFQNLVRQMEMLNISKSDVSNELNKSKEDNEELKFQVSDAAPPPRRR